MSGFSNRFASNTSVSVEKSRNEIQRTLQRYGAGEFMYGEKPGMAIIQFEMNDRRVRFSLPIPNKADFSKAHNGHRRNAEAALVSWEKACRQRWRALALAVKAKLEAVASEITSFEEEFMAHIVLPNGETVGTMALPRIEEAYKSGKMLPMLPAAGGKS